jgi:hypothetical protein
VNRSSPLLCALTENNLTCANVHRRVSGESRATGATVIASSKRIPVFRIQHAPSLRARWFDRDSYTCFVRHQTLQQPDKYAEALCGCVLRMPASSCAGVCRLHHRWFGSKDVCLSANNCSYGMGATNPGQVTLLREQDFAGSQVGSVREKLASRATTYRSAASILFIFINHPAANEFHPPPFCQYPWPWRPAPPVVHSRKQPVF